jgi:tape measure domain-containing protein
MTTISTYLKMMDQFSRPLQRVSNGVQATITAMERLKRVVETPVTMRVDTAQAAEAISRTRAQLASTGGTSAIQIAINSQTITQELDSIRQRLQSGLSSAAIQVAIDAQPALQAAATTREQIAVALGTVELQAKLELPNSEESVSRLSRMLDGVSPTVTARLAFDPNAAYTQIQTVTRQLESDPIALQATLDVSGALAEVERIKQRIASVGSSAIRVILDSESVTRVFNQIQQRMRSGTEQFMLNVSFNASEAVRKAQMMKGLLERQLNDIRAKIQVELPASITVMFTNLQRLVMKFIAATSRLRGVAGNQAAAQQQIVQLQQQIAQMQQRINNLQNQINTRTHQATQASSGWLNNLKGIAATYLSFQGVQAAITVSDDYVNTLARLDLVNDKMQTTHELQDKIFKSAEAARGSYQDMAGVIGRMGILAADAFGSNDELIAFSELMQKSFRVGGSSTMEQQSGMYQLSQAMAAGKLQGDEFRSIMENAPMLADAIAKFTGKSKGDLKDMSADGVISADIIKGAMFMMADDLNAKLETMPMTFGDVFAQLKNHALQQFGPVIERINDMLNSDRGQQFVAGIGSAISSAAAAINGLLDAAVNVYSFFSNNWAWIAPLIGGIATAFLAWKIATIGVNTVLAIQNTLQAIMAARAALATGATIAQTVAQYGLNTAMLANPITWIVIAIIALIAIIIAVIKYIINLWKTNDEFAAGLMRAWNAILNFFDLIPIFFTKVGIGIINAFQNAKVTSLKLMEDLVNGVIEGINWLIEKLNKIPGVQLDAIGHVEFSASAAAEAESIRQAGGNVIADMEAGAAAKAAKREQNVLDMLDERAAKRAAKESNIANEQENQIDYSKFGAGIDPNVDGKDADIGKVKQVDKIKGTVDISSEDLKMMRELAEMKNIQNFVTLQPSINFGDTHVRGESDINTIVARITDKLQDDIASSVDSVYV